MRVLSLVPAATEIVTALGAGESLVGISHACDYPPSVQHLPRVTTTAIDPSLPSAAIDAAVRRVHEAHAAVVSIDAAQLRALQPTLIIAQELCDVCAVSDGQTQPITAVLEAAPRTLYLSGKTLEGVYADINRIGEALDRVDEAKALVASMEHRLHHLPGKVPDPRPRVVSVEWLDPLYLAGHWVAELVAAAGGEEIGSTRGDRSHRRAWAEVAAMQPDVVLIMLCGFDVPRAQDEWAAFARSNPSIVMMIGSARVRFVDGNAYTSRPGPRLVDGATAIRQALGS